MKGELKLKQLNDIVLYDAIDLSEILELKIATINKMCRERTIKAKKIGRSWRVTQENLNEYIKDRKNK